MNPERCDCGGIGKHPAPIGGAWVLACDDCRAASEQTWYTHGDADDGVSPEQWEAWREAALEDRAARNGTAYFPPDLDPTPLHDTHEPNELEPASLLRSVLGSTLTPPRDRW